MKGVHFDPLNLLLPAKDRNVDKNGIKKYADEKTKNWLKVCQILSSTTSYIGFATWRKSNYSGTIQLSNDACKAWVNDRPANGILLY